jgi:hypothetical protein
MTLLILSSKLLRKKSRSVFKEPGEMRRVFKAKIERAEKFSKSIFFSRTNECFSFAWMPKIKPQTTRDTIPYLSDLVSFYKHVQARPPLHKDFDIREIDPEVLKAYDYVAKPFRHSFYCIMLFLHGDITLSTGFWKTRLRKPALYFKTPCR